MVWWPDGMGTDTGTAGGAPGVYLSRCPYGQPGDRLWVRETARCNYLSETPPENKGSIGVEYRTGGGRILDFTLDRKTDYPWFPNRSRNVDGSPRWAPAIHMPRWASRILLEITDVRVEKLNSIGQGAACAEGCPPFHEPIDWYQGLWEDINGKGSWSANPWVWVIQFQRVKETQG